EAHLDLSPGQSSQRRQHLPEADLDPGRDQSKLWLGGGSAHLVQRGHLPRHLFGLPGSRRLHLYSSDGLTNWKDNGYAWSPRDYQKIFCYEGSTTCNQWYKMERPGVVLENG